MIIFYPNNTFTINYILINCAGVELIHQQTFKSKGVEGQRVRIADSWAEIKAKLSAPLQRCPGVAMRFQVREGKVTQKGVIYKYKH